MTHKKAEDAETPKEPVPDPFEAAVEKLSIAAKKLCDAGLQGPAAWATVLELWRDAHGTQPKKG